MKKAIILFFLFTSLYSYSQDSDLSNKLEAIHDRDQNTRLELDKPEMKTKTDSLWAEIKIIDSENRKFIGNLLDSVGWPSGLSFKANMAIFLVIQHGGPVYMKRYAKFVEEANQNKLLPLGVYPVFVDRMRMYNDEPQVYGSQIRTIKGILYMWPVEDYANLAARRKNANLQPIENYLEGFGEEVVWDKSMTIEDLRKLMGITSDSKD